MSGRGAGAAGDAVVGPGGEHNDNGAGHVGDGAGQGGDEDGQMDLDGLRALMEARLDDFDTRLAQQADMLVQLQGMLQDGLLGGAAGPGGPIGGGQEPGALQGGAVPQALAGPEAHASKLAAKTRLNMWLNTTTRKYWILVDARPALTSIRRTELQDLLQKRVMVTGEIATQLETLSGFDVTGYMPRTATAKSVAESRFPLADQLAILAHAVSTVVGYGEHTENTTARLRTLDAAFARGIEVVREHALDFFEAMNVPANRSRLAKLINADLAAWSSKLVRAGVSAGVTWHEPPPPGQLPAVVVPVWDKLDAFIDAGGLMNVEEAAAERPAKQRKVGDKVARVDKVCFGWRIFGDPDCSHTREPASRGVALERGRLPKQSRGVGGCGEIGGGRSGGRVGRRCGGFARRIGVRASLAGGADLGGRTGRGGSEERTARHAGVGGIDKIRCAQGREVGRIASRSVCVRRGSYGGRAFAANASSRRKFWPSPRGRWGEHSARWRRGVSETGPSVPQPVRAR